MSGPLDQVYQEIILKHYRNAPRRGEMEAPDVVIPMRNPTCGDEIFLQVRVREGKIEDVRFSGHGCAISQASASMMADKVAGTTWEDADALAARFKDLLHGDEAAAKDRVLGDLRSLAGVSRLPGRVRCAMLGWAALEEAKKRITPAD